MSHDFIDDIPGPREVAAMGVNFELLTGKTESENVMRLIYEHSCEAGRWVGVPVTKLAETWESPPKPWLERQGSKVYITRQGIQAIVDHTIEAHLYRAKEAGLMFQPGLDNQVLPTRLLETMLFRCGYRLESLSRRIA